MHKTSVFEKTTCYHEFNPILNFFENNFFGNKENKKRIDMILAKILTLPSPYMLNSTFHNICTSNQLSTEQKITPIKKCCCKDMT
jgi:hypothetical protein